MESSFFSQPPIAYFQTLQSSCAPSFISCERAPYEDFGSKYESISSKVCGWAGELGKDHDLRQAAHCAWQSQTPPFEVSTELPSSALIPTAQRQPRVDFVSSATAMKSIFRASFETESDLGVAVHRLGDWLVIDDGSELSWCPHHNGPDQDLWAERVRDAEQHHRACLAKVEAAKAKSRETQQYLEKVRSMLWDAEVASRQADDELREALAELSRAAETREHLKTPADYDDLPDLDVGAIFEEEGAESPVASQEDPQLYRNFLGHSIQQIQDEPLQAVTTKKEQEVTTSSSNCQGELVLLDGPPASFHQVGVWNMADDASVVVGSRLLCLGNQEHPKLTLYLHDDRMISDTMLLEHWIECLMAGVPEFAVCFHRDGAVQSYSLYKLSELQRFLEERMELGRRVQMTLEVLRWIKRQCRLEGCSYWLSKDKQDSSLKLIKLSGNEYPQEERGAWPVCGTGAGLVLKNTFLHLPDEDESSSVRRALSCPARFLGNEDMEEDLSHLSPFSGRISTLFFRRAVSSVPGPDAARFFRQVLDLEAYSSQISAPGNSDDEEGPPVRLPTSVTAGRNLTLQACSHLGLALCELESSEDADGKNFGDLEDFPSFGSTSTSAQAAALLSRLRRDLPMPCRRQYRMLPWGITTSTPEAEREASHSSTARILGVPTLFTVLPPWPSSSSSPTDVSQLASAMAALNRSGDALDLLGAEAKHEAPGSQDAKRLEALALPIAALVLLELASAMLRAGASSQRRQAIIWRALLAGRKFAMLDAASMPRPDPQPFFSQLPPKEELLLRFEHLSGRALLLFANMDPVSFAWTQSAKECNGVLDELEHRLQRLEGWAEQCDLDKDEKEELRWNLFEGDQDCARWRVRAAWHMERSVRLLPSHIVEARCQRGCSALLNELMMTVSISLSEAAVASVALAKHAPDAAAPCTPFFQAVQSANEQLCRAEDLADVAGYKAAAALAQASRGHLCGVAADSLVQMALQKGSESPLGELLNHEEVAVVQSLCEDSLEVRFFEDMDIKDLIAKLSDLSVSETFAALQSLDPVVESDAASCLSLMASGAIQAAVGRVETLPPPNWSPEECSKAQVDMLSQALQILPGEGSGCPSLAGNALLERQAEILAAQAHLVLTEVHLHGSGGISRSRQKPKVSSRAQWNLQKARSALHRAAAVKMEHDATVNLLLIHAHLLGAQVQGQETGPKKLEQSLEELIAASRISVRLATLEPEAAKETRSLVLERVRNLLRALCTGKACNEGWKDLYRFALKLEPSQLDELVSGYEKMLL